MNKIQDVVKSKFGLSVGQDKKVQCVGHNGTDNNLWIKVNDDGTVAFRCYSRQCTGIDILQGLGLNPDNYWINYNNETYIVGDKKQKKLKPYFKPHDLVETYCYIDENNKIRYMVDRTDPKGKFIPYFEGSNGKLYSGLNNGSKVLYNLPNVIKSDTILWVEGEKDANNLIRLGFTATTRMGGATTKINTKEFNKYDKYLKDKNLIIFYDHNDTDSKGKKYMEELKIYFSDVVKSMKVVHFNTDKSGYDVSDWIEDNNATKEDIGELINKAEEINILELKTEKNTQELADTLGIHEENHSLYKIHNNGSKKLLSTFSISLNQEIINIENGKVFFDVTFKNNMNTVNTIIESIDFNNKNKFMNHLTMASYGFYGSQNELQDIKRYIALQPHKIANAVNSIGLHSIDDKLYFVADDKAIDKELNINDNITLSEDRKVVKTNILDVPRATKKDLIDLVGLLYNYNELSVTSAILGVIPIYLLKPLLFERNIKPPHLIIYGEAGAGKSQTVDSIINPIFNLGDNHNLAYGSITKFTLHKKVASTNNIPVVIEEFKPSYESIILSNLVSSTLRSAYDTHTATRGRADQSIEEYQLLAPMILIGEEGQEETAIKERSIILNLSKLGRKGKENIFKKLRNEEDKLNKLGRLILESIITMDLDKVELEYLKMLNVVKTKLDCDRVAENIACIMLGNKIIQKIFKDNGLDILKESNLNNDDILKALIDNQKTEVFDGTNSTISNVTKTLEVFSFMADNLNLIKDVHYTIVNDTELAIHMNSAFEVFISYVNKNYEQEQKRDLITNKNQFIKQLKKESYFIKNGTANFNGKRKKSYILDLEILGEKDIEVDSFKVTL